MYACMLIQNGRNQEAHIILKQLASNRYEPSKVNLLLSIAAQNEGLTSLAEKYKSIGLLE